eukprot:COSAG01_NODE_3955_length_5495_cov_215.437280_2_plen_126_part_00
MLVRLGTDEHAPVQQQAAAPSPPLPTAAVPLQQGLQWPQALHIEVSIDAPKPVQQHVPAPPTHTHTAPAMSDQSRAGGGSHASGKAARGRAAGEPHAPEDVRALHAHRKALKGRCKPGVVALDQR